MTLTGEGFFEVISGTGFVGNLVIVMCGAPLTDVEVQGEVRNVVLPPAGNVTIRVGDTVTGTTGAAVPGSSSDVVVTRPDGQTATLADGFVCSDVPTANDQTVSTLEDGAVDITLTSDVAAAEATYAVASGPANGALSGTAPGPHLHPERGFQRQRQLYLHGRQWRCPGGRDRLTRRDRNHRRGGSVNDAPSFTAGGDQDGPPPRPPRPRASPAGPAQSASARQTRPRKP